MVLLEVMAEDKPYEFETKTKKNDDSIDIIDKLTEFVNYLNIDGQMLLKPSKIDLQNEMKFEQRAEQIIKRHRRHDQIVVEENAVNELQKYINVITNDLDNKLNKKGISELESKDITEMYDCLMNVKMLILKSSKNAKSLKDFIKLNKISLDNVTKIENELRAVLDKIPNEKLSKKSEIKVAQKLRRRPSILCISNVSRRNNHDANIRVHPRIQVERIRQLGNLTNDNVIFNSQTNEALRMRFENDHTDMVESFSNKPNIDQNTRYRRNEESMSNDLMSVEDDLQLVESPNFDSSVNLCKDNEDNNSGDVYLLLQPYNSWMES